jgi:molecular chaperone DnaJ
MSTSKKRDYYEVLGVGKTASADEIKQAFRKLAMKHHPDRGGDAEKFKEINEAYQVLSDQEKRTKYDRFGFNAPEFGGADAFSGQGFSSFSDIFDMFFGGSGGGGFESFFGGSSRGQGGRMRRVQGEDIEITVTIPFLEAVFGTEKKVTYRRDEPCHACDGTGAEDPNSVKQCPQCRGSGQEQKTTRTFLGMATQVVPCSRCEGTGQIIAKKCRECGGRKRLSQERTTSIKIPPGIDTGVYLKAEGQGHIPTKDAIPGDLLIGVKIQSDKRFQRDGYDIISEIDCSFAQAIKGCDTVVETVDGPVSVKIPPGTPPETLIRLKGKGIPTLESRGKARGNHILKVRINIPSYDKLTSKQKQLIDSYIELERR